MVRPNMPLNRTRSGTPPAGLISFWPYGVVPLRAGQLHVRPHSHQL